jgi:hypothetical protein
MPCKPQALVKLQSNCSSNVTPDSSWEQREKNEDEMNDTTTTEKKVKKKRPRSSLWERQSKERTDKNGWRMLKKHLSLNSQRSSLFSCPFRISACVRRQRHRVCGRTKTNWSTYEHTPLTLPYVKNDHRRSSTVKPSSYFLHKTNRNNHYYKLLGTMCIV